MYKSMTKCLLLFLFNIYLVFCYQSNRHVYKRTNSQNTLSSRKQLKSLRKLSTNINLSKIHIDSLNSIDTAPLNPPLSQSEFIFPEVGPEIYIGSIVSLIPIIWATYEFTSRLKIQQRCLVCNGSGLVSLTKQGIPCRTRKCYSCGGFLPWVGWKRFFLSSVTDIDIGNGGILQRPSKYYEKNNEEIRKLQNRNDNKNEK